MWFQRFCNVKTLQLVGLGGGPCNCIVYIILNIFYSLGVILEEDNAISCYQPIVALYGYKA